MPTQGITKSKCEKTLSKNKREGGYSCLELWILE